MVVWLQPVPKCYLSAADDYYQDFLLDRRSTSIWDWNVIHTSPNGVSSAVAERVASYIYEVRSATVADHMIRSPCMITANQNLHNPGGTNIFGFALLQQWSKDFLANFRIL